MTTELPKEVIEDFELLRKAEPEIDARDAFLRKKPPEPETETEFDTFPFTNCKEEAYA